MKNNTLITIAVIVAVIALAWFIINKSTPTISESLAKCIGERSEYYGLYGCPHCATQKEMFGDNFKLLNSVDCYYSKAFCIEQNVTSFPTWVISGQKYPGVQSKEKLAELTGCTLD